MDTFERLTLLFSIWQKRFHENPTAFGSEADENYPAACAGFLMDLDADTDGEKLFIRPMNCV